MKTSIKRIALFVVLLCLPAFTAMGEENWKIMTEELPPYNFEKGGEVHGISADILLQLLSRNGISVVRGDIKLLPWPRAYRMVQDTPGAILFSAARTVQREKLFKWVGPITDLNIGLVALKKNHIELKSLEDAEKYRIGTIRDGAPEQLVLKAGLKEGHLDRIADPKLNIKKLRAGRIDLFAFSVPTTRYLMIGMGMNPDEYESVYTLKHADLYYAFHKDTDEKIIRTLNAALQKMRKPGADGRSEVDRIVDSYLNP